MPMRILQILRACTLTLGIAALAPSARAETITVTHWGAAFYGAPYAVAMEKGFFKKRGVDITGILTSAGGGESIADILWITQKDSSINSIKDIVGKKVSFTSPGSVTNMLILMCMKAANIDRKDVTLVPAGGIGANLSAVLNKAVDTGMTGEPVWSENKDKVKPAFWTKDCFPPQMTQTVMITTTDFAQTGGDKLRAIIAARREGVEYIIKNPDESADIVAKAYNGEPKLYREVFKNFVAINYFGDGRLNYKGMDRMAEGMELIGQIKGKPDWKSMVDTSFL